jgi:hypothetical protein
MNRLMWFNINEREAEIVNIQVQSSILKVLKKFEDQTFNMLQESSRQIFLTIYPPLLVHGYASIQVM